MSPDPRWLPFLDRLNQTVLILLLAGLGYAIALGHVDEKTSYGLSWVVTGLISYLLSTKNQVSESKHDSNSNLDK